MRGLVNLFVDKQTEKISILVYHTEKEGAISRFFSVKKARSSLRKRLFAL